MSYQVCLWQEKADMQQLQQTILLYLNTLTCTVAVIIGENETLIHFCQGPSNSAWAEYQRHQDNRSRSGRERGEDPVIMNWEDVSPISWHGLTGISHLHSDVPADWFWHTAKKRKKKEPDIPGRISSVTVWFKWDNLQIFFFYKKTFQSPCVQLLINKCDSSLIIPVTDHKQSLQYSI